MNNDKSAQWIKYLARPQNLFTASLWHSWYTSSYFRECFDIPTPKTKMIEDENGIVY